MATQYILSTRGYGPKFTCATLPQTDTTWVALSFLTFLEEDSITIGAQATILEESCYA